MNEPSYRPALAEVQALATPNALWRHIASVESVSWFIREGPNPSLRIGATGSMQSRGWREPLLCSRRYPQGFPADGVWEFDFYALPPADTVAQVTTPVTAVLDWSAYALYRRELKGIAVVAQYNRIVRQFS